MSVRAVGRGMFEVKLAGDPHTYSCMVLGDPYCTCDFFKEREASNAAEKNPMAKPRVWCPHLEAASQEHNTTSRHGRQEPGHYVKQAFTNAKDDLVHMLEEMDDEPGA